MSAASALGWLLVASFRGGVRAAARRVRSPRHFLGMLLGLGWLVYVFTVNRASLGRAVEHRGLADAAWMAELLALLVLLLLVARGWLFGRAGAALGFSEAETQLLFAAPLSRRQLVAYKLAQGALGSVVAVAALALLFGHGGLGARAVSAAAGWITLQTVALHLAGATLTRAALAQHGVAALRRRVVTLALLAAAVAAVALGLVRAPPLSSFAPGLEGLAAWTRLLVETAPLSWALLPLRASLDVVFAPGPEAFLRALPAALAVLLAHLAWVFSSDAAFEEAALEASQRRAAQVEQLRGGSVQVARRRRGTRSFRLAAEGRPELAFAWKALVRATRFVSIPVLSGGLALSISLGVAAFAGAGLEGGPGAGTLVAFMAALFFAIVVPFGPTIFAGDLRRDVSHLDVLRALPLRGHQVLAGELAVPFAQIAATQWLLLGLAASLGSAALPGRAGERLALALAAGLVGPAISAMGLVAANALVVLYPEWFAGAETSAPFGQMGSRTLVTLATLLAALLALVPAALAGGLVLLLLRPALGLWAAPPAGLAGALAVLALAVGALRLVGRALERVDWSA